LAKVSSVLDEEEEWLCLASSHAAAFSYFETDH